MRDQITHTQLPLLPLLALLPLLTSCRHHTVISGRPGVPLMQTAATYSYVNGTQENSPNGLPNDALLDQATIGVEPQRTCANVELRQPLGWDQPASMLRMRCSNGQDKTDGEVFNEQQQVRDYPFTQDPQTLHLYGFGLGISVPVGPPQERIFRVSQRSFTVCCPLTAGEVFKLSVAGHLGRPGLSPSVRTDFVWRLRMVD